MRRRHSIIGLFAPALVCLVVAAGCARTESGRRTITYSFWGTPEQQKTELAVIRAFEAAHPGVRVVPRPVPGAVPRYNDKLQAMFVGQVAPDVVMIEMSRYDDWASRGVLADISDDVEELARSYDMMPVVRQAFARDGRFYAAPINAHAQAMFYNREALAAAGVEAPAEGFTWEELLTLAPRLARHAGASGAVTDYAFQLPPPTILFWAFGGRLFDDLYQPQRATVNSPGGAAAVRFMRRALATDAVLPPDIGALASDTGTYQLFRDGRVALFVSGRWMTPDFMGIRNFTWDVLPIPAGPAGRISQHGGTALGVWRGSREPELARAFVRFYASPEGVRLTMAGRRYVPVYRRMAFSEEFLRLTPPESLAVFSRSMEAGAALNYLYAPGYSDVKRLFDAAMEKAIIRTDLAPEAILAELEQELNRWLKQNQR
ncbi:MAG: sugar ABC transporter substrate-binding protein [Opitutaceae bacterium]|nr:sugar ABC transporter substrate-binding protein [Opitutaceae bacterium]